MFVDVPSSNESVPGLRSGSAFVVSSLDAASSSLASSALFSFFASAGSVIVSTTTSSDSSRFRSEGRYLRKDPSETDMTRKSKGKGARRQEGNPEKVRGRRGRGYIACEVEITVSAVAGML